MVKLLVFDTRLFENLENSPHGFCLGSSFGYDIYTQRGVREQFEAMHGHKKETNVYVGHKWIVEIRNYQREIQSCMQETDYWEGWEY